MKAFFRLILLALVLLVVALVSALTAMRFAIHGREVAVPDLQGKTVAEARRAAEPSGLQVEVERQYYSPTVAEGRIVSQMPLSRTQVRRGWAIRVAESLGPQRIGIPSVLGESQRAAEINIRRRGLDIAGIATLQTTDAAPDQVLGQSPSPNASEVSVPKISLLVTDAAQPQAFVMPSFVGQPLGSVTQNLQDAGLRLGTVSAVAQSSATAGLGDVVPGVQPVAPPSISSIIVAQTPKPGDKVVAGSAVSFQVR
jgi:eukaryotic-like serine/threonine-protein kinase